jgi:dTDP-4-dehydrorhamnose 3,5-epimerase
VLFTELSIAGAFVVDIEPVHDDRGYFARLFDGQEFQRRGLAASFPQVSLSHSLRLGTIRGMHYQVSPAVEAKLVRCTRGGMHDVIIDMRRDSPTYLRHAAVELTAENHRAVYIPAMCAHGFQALEDNTETLYHIDNLYTPAAARGIRHDDPAVAITWPLPVSVVSARDRAWPLLAGEAGT